MIQLHPTSSTPNTTLDQTQTSHRDKLSSDKDCKDSVVQ
jgi:hypothetical protein